MRPPFDYIAGNLKREERKSDFALKRTDKSFCVFAIGKKREKIFVLKSLTFFFSQLMSERTVCIQYSGLKRESNKTKQQKGEKL